MWALWLLNELFKPDTRAAQVRPKVSEEEDQAGLMSTAPTLFFLRKSR